MSIYLKTSMDTESHTNLYERPCHPHPPVGVGGGRVDVHTPAHCVPYPDHSPQHSSNREAVLAYHPA